MSDGFDGDPPDDDDWEYEQPQAGRPVELDERQLKVRLPSGAVQPVLTADEQDYLATRVLEYADQLRLTNISDTQDLDRVLVMELMVHRWGTWLGQGGLDYGGGPIDERVYTDHIKSYATELRITKKHLGIDKPARDRAVGEGSVHAYWSNLLERAKAFGIMRNRQATRATELFMQLVGMVTFYRNASDEERREFHHTAEDILDWVHEIAWPEFDQIDRSFRENDQRYWIRTM